MFFFELGLVLCSKYNIQQEQIDTWQVHLMGHVHSAPMLILPWSPLHSRLGYSTFWHA